MTVPAPLPHIQWHEGMLLSPQHFQQESARTDNLVAWQSLNANALAWGVKHFDIDDSLLANGVLRVNSLVAVFSDGTPFVYNAENDAGPALEIDLSQWESILSAGELNVYLAKIFSLILNSGEFSSWFCPFILNSFKQANFNRVTAFITIEIIYLSVYLIIHIFNPIELYFLPFKFNNNFISICDYI